MKHVKNFESVYNKYTVGDVVIVNANIYALLKNEPVVIVGKYDNSTWRCYLIFNKERYGGSGEVIISEFEIVRKLDKSEIEDLKVKLDTEKYNL